MLYLYVDDADLDAKDLGYDSKLDSTSPDVALHHPEAVFRGRLLENHLGIDFGMRHDVIGDDLSELGGRGAVESHVRSSKRAGDRGEHARVVVGHYAEDCVKGRLS